MKTLPMMWIRQAFARPQVADPVAALRLELDGCGVPVASGARIAIAVGSRGIANLEPLVREVVRWVRSRGGAPFIVPAMGSHGGATAAGQAEVLAGYGISEARVGAPVRSCMDVVELPRDACPVPVTFDRLAHEADATIVLNRIKPHTSFRGRYESGLMKMLAIGLGKHPQALAIHARGIEGLREIMPAVARQVLAHANVVLGVAVVENACDETMLVKAIPAARIPGEEPALLDLARAHRPHLPLDAIDLLVVDEIGKNISGLGMDTQVIGRLKIRGQPEPATPDIRAILVRDLTPETHGNAAGMGLADILLRTAFSRIDFRATYANVMTTGFPERGKLPMVAETDAEALQWAFRMAGMPGPAEARVLRIRNTLRLDRLQASPAAVEALRGRADITIEGPVEPVFTPDGAFAPW
jgi:hypothetical protein